MPTYTKTGKYKMHWLTRGIYEALKTGGLIDPYALYWIKDENIIFRGNDPLMDVYAFVDDFTTPYTGVIKPKTLCIKTSSEEGQAFLEVRLLKEDRTWETVVPPIFSSIDELTEEDKTLPSRYAVRTFVDDRLNALREYFDALENSMREMLQVAQEASEAAYDASVEAVTAANNAANSSLRAESYAVGGTDTRPGENTDNAKYYKEKAQEAAASASGDEEAIAQMKEEIEQTADEVESDRQAVVSMKASVEQSEQNAKSSELAAKQSETAAHTSEVNAHTSEVNAKQSETNAKASELAAKQSDTNAHTSEVNAATSETNAHNSELAAKASENAAALSETNAHTSETNAKASELAAKQSETAAHTSEVNAHNSEVAAKDSEDAAKASENAAALSETNAATSESNANASKIAAANSAAAALTSEQHAKTSETNAANSATAAANSATAAHTSEVNANTSKNAAATSATNAANSATAAANSATAAHTSETNAATSESAAATSADEAEQSAISAYNSANSASGSATAAHTSEVNAKASETKVEQDAAEAASSAQAAETSETNAAASAKLAESWAVGETGVRQDEDTNNAKYWAEQARQASPDGKADKVIGAVEGDIAGLDATGNLTDSGIPGDKVARQDGWYDELHSGTAGNLVDPRAPSTGRKFGFDTSCGNISISDDGTADPTLLKGTTYVKNQLVGDSKVVKELGQGVVTSSVAVAGDIDHAYIKGRLLVRNQLVPASVEKEGSSSTGVLEVSDAVAGDALVLKMTAPRSVVVNQLVQNGNFANNMSSWTEGSSLMSTSVASNVCTVIYRSGGDNNTRRHIRQAIAVPDGHICLVHCEIKDGTSDMQALSLSSFNVTCQTSSTWIGYDIKPTINSNKQMYVGVYNFNMVSDITAQIRNVMLVDLTQYFNGDSALIDSITSWDDLVAYDPRFAQYVEYNTGEVAGVQPTVKVTGKNLFNKSKLATDYGYTAGTVVVDGRTCANVYGSSVSSINGSHTIGYSFAVPQYCAISFYAKKSSTNNSCRLTFLYEDGTSESRSQTSMSDTWAQYAIVPPKKVKRFTFNNGSNGGYWATYIDIDTIQIELGSSATAYEPYHDGGTAQVPAPLFAVGNAADEYEAVQGVTTRNLNVVNMGNLNWVKSSIGGYMAFMATLASASTANIMCICPRYTYSSIIKDKIIKMQVGAVTTNKTAVIVVDTSYSTVEDFKNAMSGVSLAFARHTPTTSQSTPTQISLQAGNNVAMQTDGGRTASSLALGYDGTSFDVPLKTGRSYLVKKGSTSTLVTDGTTQSVTGGQDMIVDLNTLYNNVSSLITPIADWNALVADTGMYGSYTAYDEGTVVHSDQTEVKVSGKNLLDDSIKGYNNTYLYLGSTTLEGGMLLPAGTYTWRVFYNGNESTSQSGGTGYISIDGTATYNQHTFILTKPSYCHCRVYPLPAADERSKYTAQIELGSVATAYEPYYSGGTATTGLLKGVPGSVYDQLDAVTGNVTTRIGSYTFTGNETWGKSTSTKNMFSLINTITDAYRINSSASVVGYVMTGYDAVGTINNVSPDKVFSLNTTQFVTTNQLLVKDSSCSTTTEIAAKMAGKTVYYRLATYTKSTTTPQPLTQSTGNLNVLQTAGTLPVSLDVRHAVSEWDEPIVRNCKYIFRDNGVDSLVTGSTTVTYKHVVGGQHKLINLTQWFGRNREPSIADFYKLFPTWKDADIPYDRGTILNYKGTGVRTIGFNAYNHATGTAVLLGGNKYQICGTYTSCTYTDQWGNVEELDIDDKGIFTPVNNGTLTVVGGNDTDTCVHLCWSGYKDYGKPDYEWFPYEEKGVEWDLSQWFPDGMNGIGDNQDLMQNNSMTQKWGIKVFNGTEDWQDYSSYNGFSFELSDMKSGNMQEGACNYIPVYPASPTYLSGAACVRLGAANSVVHFCYVREEGIIDTVDDWKAYLASLYAAGTPLILIYPLAEPVISEVTPTQNFSYPVNDFGTEQSLSVNTLTLLTTDLDAEIRYSLDFTRTVANYSKIEDGVKQLVEEKDNLARQDGNYADKGGTYTYATQLLDPNAPPTEASYGNRTAAGDVSIADNGTADVTSLQGTTQIQNQLVHDTNMNTKSSVDGRLVLTDAVGGQLSRLEIHGGCVVHNQLVKEFIEKTVTGTGRLGVEDGVAGNAKSLVMTAPRSVVMNQWASFYTRTQNGVTATVGSDGLITFSGTSTDVYNNCGIWYNSMNIVGHTYVMMLFIITNPNNISLTYAQPNRTPRAKPFVKYTLTQTEAEKATYIGFVFNNGVDYTGVSCRAMFIDLTQYFNGNVTLINSITSWDDLVAYDSSFASYVPYDTGTVKGVQPTVKVNHTTDVECPVELFGMGDATDSFDGVSGVVTRNMGSYTFTGSESIELTNWQHVDGYYAVGFSKNLLPGYKKTQDNGEVCNCIISGLLAISYGSCYSGTPGVAIYPFDTYGLFVRVPTSIATNNATLLTWLTGRTLYYELADPTTSQYNPTTIPTVDIYNTALQTAGTRPCGLSLTYDGKDQTIALNPSHTYVFNDNQEEDSVLTGQSSIEVVGGEDQLVDITQLYNGDASKIANIHSWASLSTRFHRYRDFQPYNPGTVEPDTPVIRVFPDEYAYGIVYDPSQNTPSAQRVILRNGVITEVDSFTSMPCHNLYRCVMDDLSTRHISYYLDDNDSTKKYNGTRNGVTSDGSDSVLTGADGDVMVEIPVSYWYLDEDYDGKYLWLISDKPFMGVHHPAEIHDYFYVSPNGDTPRTQYVGAYRASICDENGNALNTTEGALTQVTGTASTNKARSIAGALPYVNVSLNDLTIRAGRNGGSTVNTKFHQWLFLLMAIESGTLDNQAISYGYAGGPNNALCFWRKSGRVNAGNGTDSITAVENTQDMDNFQKFDIGSTTVQRDTNMDADGRYAWSIYNRTASSTRYFTSSPTPSNGDPVYTASTGTTTAGTVASYSMNSNRTIQFQYRGIENPFGEVWEFEHGFQKYMTGEVRSFRGSDNVTYTRDPADDGASSRAWKDPSENVFWTTTGSLTTSTFLYSDPALTTVTTVKYKDQPVYRYSSEGYWETLATTDYTSTAQRTAVTPTYTDKHKHWPLSGWDSMFDPVTFFYRKTGSPGASGRYLPDYFYNDGTVGDRVGYRGGNATDGARDGLGCLHVHNGLSSAGVVISGRLSA